MSEKKEKFLACYREMLGCYAWAKEPGRLDKFMASVEDTISGRANSWNFADADIAKEAFKLVSAERYTLKNLRAL